MILVIGKTGQLARELVEQGDVTAVGRDQVDLARPAALRAFLDTQNPGALINAAAYTSVDKAEEERNLAMAINGAAVGTMAEWAAARGLPFVHVSTDYVFDGTGQRPWTPEDPTGPLGVYGQSKLAGEALTVNAGGAYAILRTSWVVSAHGHNFVKTMLRLGAERDRLSIVADQIGGLTPARDLARACLRVAESLNEDPGKAGIYHYAGTPDSSWADVARAIFDMAGLDCAVEDIPSEAYPTPAARPKNSRLDCAATEMVFGLKRPDWRVSLRAILNDLGPRYLGSGAS